jgi:hypothetical protein
MSSDNQKRAFRASGAPESILAKKGKLPITLAQLQSLRLKQTLPADTRVVIVFSADGNVNTGVTTQEIKMTSINDVQKVQAARSMAHQVLGVKNKRDLEQILCESVLSTIGPIPETQLDPGPGAVQELRRVKVDLERVQENTENLKKVLVTTALEKRVKAYLNRMGDLTKEVLRKHAVLQLTKGSQPKESISLTTALMHAGVPRYVYNKLILPNLVESLQMRVDHLLFGSKISKGLKLSYEELNSAVIQDTDLFDLINFRNSCTIKAARSNLLAQVMRTGLDETEVRRLAKIQLLMVGPGNYSQEWAGPQPMPPVSYGAVGEILLKINQLEVNYHSGVGPIGTRVSAYWSGQVIDGKTYPANEAPNQVLNQVTDDAKTVVEDERGRTVFLRDAQHGQMLGIVARPQFRTYLGLSENLKPKAPDLKDKELKKDDDEINYLPIPPKPVVVNLQAYAPQTEPKVFSISAAGKAWSQAFISKIFLKTSDDPIKQKKVASGTANIALPDEVVDSIKEMKIPQELKKRLAAFLMQFQSVGLMRQAYTVFRAEMQRMDIDGSWVAPETAGDLRNPFGDDDEDI